VSNFLIWQAAYSEWFITLLFGPTSTAKNIIARWKSFAHRDRRYGKVSSGELQESNA